MHDILAKSLTVRGFIQTEFVDEQQDNFLQEAAQWIDQGKLKWREDIVEGLEQAPEAFIGLLEGRNFGKLIVRLA
jgi:NADPH-dependent curcumin reductase CurA